MTFIELINPEQCKWLLLNKELPPIDCFEHPYLYPYPINGEEMRLTLAFFYKLFYYGDAANRVPPSPG